MSVWGGLESRGKDNITVTTATVAGIRSALSNSKLYMEAAVLGNVTRKRIL